MYLTQKPFFEMGAVLTDFELRHQHLRAACVGRKPSAACAGTTCTQSIEFLEDEPALYLDEMQANLSERTGIKFPVSTICTTMLRDG